MQIYSVGEAARATGATRAQVEYLVKQGLVTPAEDAPQRGVSRMYTRRQLPYIAVAAQLLSGGVELDHIKTMIGTDRPAPGAKQSVIDFRWRELQHPERGKGSEFLVVSRVVDPAEDTPSLNKRSVGYSHHFVSAAELAPAVRARAATGALVVHLKGIAKQLEQVLGVDADQD